MELCDESLTAFLERSPGPLSYHVQVNICHDIALALVYLHSNGLIHRDLTGNNVLMIPGPRAKITDFGMSKLACVNPRMTALTLCPGNALYMAPEALDKGKSYTAKLDIFSLGVIIIQILTRLFPNPTDRFCIVRIPQGEDEDEESEVRKVVPETIRRQSHLMLIPDTHPLKLLALQCIKKKENERPSATQLCENLSELEQSSQYRESKQQNESSSDIQQLQLQLQGKTQEAIEHQARVTELENTVANSLRQLEEQRDAFHRQLLAKDRELLENSTQLREQQHTIQGLNRQLQAKDGQLQQNLHARAARDQALEKKERELQQTQQLIAEFQESVQLKDKTISDLQGTISGNTRKIKQLEQGETTSRDTQQQEPGVKPAAEKDISTMWWKRGQNAPEEMCRGAAVVHGSTAYIRLGDSNRVYSYQNHSGKEQWSHLPDNPNEVFGLAVIDGLVTSVGGVGRTLLSLTEEGEWKQWSQVFPPMTTPRENPACVTTEKALVVAGGYRGGYLDTVEVMNTETKVWAKVASLPEKCSSFTATVFGDRLYLAGGLTDGFSPSKSVFACSVTDLLTYNTFGSKLRRTLSPHQNVWQNVSSLPVTDSTLVAFGGHLLAIGGRDDSGNPTSNVSQYDFHTESWTLANNKRSECFAVTFSENELIVVGGYASNSVDILF